MKKVIALILCIWMLFNSVTVFADTTHFESGHETVEYTDFGISFEFPKDWEYVEMEKTATVLFPLDNKEVYFVLSFVENESTDVSSKFEKLFVRTAVEKLLEGSVGESQTGNAEDYELSDGRYAALAIGTKDESITVCTGVHVGDYVVVLSLISDLEHFESEYGEDIDAILSSSKEI